MKKTAALLLAFIIVFSLAGCREKHSFPDLPDEKAVSGNDAVSDAVPEDVPSGDETSLDLTSPDEETQESSGSAFGHGKPKLLQVRLTVSPDKNTVSKDEKFGSALLNMSQEEFEELGFTLGDSCSIAFENGASFEDVPYFNGYYVKNGCPVIVAYPGNPYVSITLNNQGIWDYAGLQEGDSVTITLEEAGRYSAIQEALGQIYSFDRAKYPSDEAFCNFRSFSGGSLKKDFLYRGASPVDNSRGRAPYTDGLLKKNGIRYVVDLADSEANMKKYMSSSDFDSPYARDLYENGSVVLLDMSSSYASTAYKEKVVQGLKAALKAEGPVYIHCMEGKDRTGFVCMLIEALAGAKYDDMLADYMTTYANYFGVSKTGTPEKYEAIAELYFVPFMEFLHGTDDVNVLKTADFSKDAEAYLKDGGMTDGEISAFKGLVCG